nr:hypothetical protein [Azospirillum soli]
MRGRVALFALAVALAGCQFPGFEPPRRTAAGLPPPSLPKPPPEERGIWIVGSPSGEGPIRTASERFGGSADTKPRLVAEGTGPGFRTFCAGVGLEHPDMVVSDRPVRPEEVKRCRAKGITMTEYQLGPKQYVYVKDAHMATIPGVRDFTESWGVTGKPVSGA